MNNITVLVVEDDAPLLELYRHQIEAAGFTFIGLSQAETLLRVFQESHPDIILIDIHLPGINGFHIIEKLYKLPDADSVKILFISSDEKEESISRAFSVGADDYIIKPVNWLILINRLQHMAVDIERQKRIAILANTFKNASEGIIITDSQAKIIEVNDSFSRITGFSLGEVEGRTPAVLSSGKHDKKFYEAMWISLVTQGHWSGEIWNQRKNGHIYPEWLSINAVYGRGGNINNFIGVFSDISHIKEQEALLLRQANHDGLTGLPNRMLLIDRLEQAISLGYRDNTGLAILFIDLDGFKDINDHHGHDAGDKVLIEMARRYQSLLRRADTVCRYGGDEYVILASSLKSPAEVRIIADKILQATQKPVDLGTYEVSVGCSIGINIQFKAIDDAEQLIQQADEAMYKAKRSGKNRYEIYID